MNGDGDIPSWRNDAPVSNGSVFQWTCSVVFIAHRRMAGATRALGRGLIFVTGHFGSCELGA